MADGDLGQGTGLPEEPIAAPSDAAREAAAASPTAPAAATAPAAEATVAEAAGDKRRSKGLLIGGIAVVVVLIIGVIGVVIATRDDGGGDGGDRGAVGNVAQGIYVTNYMGKPISPDIPARPEVAGLFLRYAWSDLQPTATTWDWSLLDGDFAAAKANGKGVILAIGAGDATPAWVFKAGGGTAQGVDFTIVAGGGAAANCNPMTIPLPWDPAYQATLEIMIKGVKAHLVSTGYLAQVVQVKITGINQSTVELRLPTGDGTVRAKSGCPESNAIATWQSMGYKPSVLVAAYQKIALLWKYHFNTQQLATPVIPSDSFPDLDDNSQPIKRDLALDQIVRWSIANLGPNFGVNYAALRDSVGTPLDVYKPLGAKIGYQASEKETSQPLCPGIVVEKSHPTTTCDPAYFQRVAANGVAHFASWIEIFENTLRAYGPQVASANQAVINNPNA